MTNQQRFDNDDGTDPAQELAQEYVSEHIEDVCEAHESECPYRYVNAVDTDAVCLHWREAGPEARAVPFNMPAPDCIYHADAVTARMEAMKEDAL